MSTVDLLLKTFLASFTAGVKEGDRCVMAAALYNRVVDPTLQQERQKRPERTRVIQTVLHEQFAINGLPKWGATAVRGDLMDSKEHIRAFIDLVNNLEPSSLRDAWKRFGAAYKTEMEKLYKPIQLNPRESIVEQIGDLGKRPSGGRIQQPLCYAVIDYIVRGLGSDYKVSRKRVFAGDQQSGQKGDIQVSFSGKAVAAFEIKAHLVDSNKVNDVLADHGAHAYSLVIVATGYTADARLSPRQNLVLVTVDEVIATCVMLGGMIHRAGLEQAGRRVLEAYNVIMRDIEERPDLCVEIPPLS